MLFFFQSGKQPVGGSAEISLPVSIINKVDGCAFFNEDYMVATLE